MVVGGGGGVVPASHFVSASAAIRGDQEATSGGSRRRSVIQKIDSKRFLLFETGIWHVGTFEKGVVTLENVNCARLV